MNADLKSTSLYGAIKLNSSIRFDDSKLFSKDKNIPILLRGIKLYFGNNTNSLKTLVGIESSYEYINNNKIEKTYYGRDIKEIEKNKDIEVKELITTGNDYVKYFEINLDEDVITYLKITSLKGFEIEFGEKKDENKVTILNYNGDNIINYFWGNYDNDGINALGFKFIPRLKFRLINIFPLLYFKKILSKNPNLKNKYKDSYKELLKDDISMQYLYLTCIQPEAILSSILKFC
jgi:hypothetical protein